MNILRAITDSNLFLPYLSQNNFSKVSQKKPLASWGNWGVVLKVIYGIPVRKPKNLELIRQCTGRDSSKLPKDGFNTVLLLVGRRGGKSKISGLIAAYESLFSGKEQNVSLGEIPMLTITSPSRDQSSIIKSYCRAALGAPMLDAEIDGDILKSEFSLKNGVNVRILTGSFISVRGYSQICVIVDEICFFGVSEESKVKSDTELIRAIRPALLTTKGRLICVSTKYAPKGWAYQTWKRHYGNDNSRTLVWDAPSRVMNPTLAQQDIDDAIAEDPESARAEYLNQWRESISVYLPVEVIETCVIKGRKELLPRSSIRYAAFADMSGGRSDSACLAIAHKDNRKAVIDFIREWKAPFSPYAVAGEMASELARYNLKTVVGDKYAAEYTTQAFRTHHIKYTPSKLNKSELYLELLPRICSREIELLDNERLIVQLSSLERRCRSGGNDVIDHHAGGHDDLANVIAGVSTLVGKPKIIVGGGFRFGNEVVHNFGHGIGMNRALMARAIVAQQAKRNAI